MYHVYALKSLRDDNHYFGQTDNLSERVNLHNLGKVTSTKYRRPFVLVGYKTFETRNEARWFEYNIKHHSDKKRKFLNELNTKPGV